MLLLLLSLFTAQAEDLGRIKQASQVHWLGIDYTQALFVGNGDFNEPQQVASYYPGEWNELVRKELMDDIEKSLKKVVVQDYDVAKQLNEQVTVEQIERREGGSAHSQLDADRIAAHVRGYPISGDGVGLVLIADKLVKSEETGCGWLTFVDMSSKEVLYTQRACNGASGFGFRNYWFRPYKDMLSGDLGKLRKRFKL